MRFANNLQLLRKTNGNLSQETLADKMDVSRQTVSKWESGAAYPEVDKLISLSEFFHCTLDQLLKEDLARRSDAYSPVKLVIVERFRMAQYTVISAEPEDDSIAHMERWAQKNGLHALTGGKVTTDRVRYADPLHRTENRVRHAGVPVRLRDPGGFRTAHRGRAPCVAGQGQVRARHHPRSVLRAV